MSELDRPPASNRRSLPPYDFMASKPAKNFQHLPAGMNTLSVNHPDFDVFEKTVRGVVGEVRTVTVSLTPRHSERLF